MMNLEGLENKLQKADRKQAVLYLFCNFISLMLITAYTAVMLSPTVLGILPEGGDSRKQMYAVFVLALAGCVVFTIYASTLFFRKKSRQLGILMALGASRRRLAPGLFREVLLLSSISSLAGILAGFPFVLILWKSFRLFLTDSKEMEFHLNLRCLFVSAAFLLFVAGCACILSFVYLRRTNILDIVSEEHKNEPVKELGPWCGPVGILLLFAGAVVGYSKDSFFIDYFHQFPPAWTNIAFAPVFIGLYMIMLHTVVHGWTSRKKHPYKNIISRSMMKFQGRQTVNSLIVSTVLIAGGSFAIFYLPMLSTGMLLEVNTRPCDYFYHYRADQAVPDKEEISGLAARYGISLKDWKTVPYITLGADGSFKVFDKDDRFHIEYSPLRNECSFLSESSYCKLTGQRVNVPSGSYFAITNEEETEGVHSDSSLLTNMDTRETMDTAFGSLLHYGLLGKFCVLDDKDYQHISSGLTPQWEGNLVSFNVDGKDSYAFADAFFDAFVSSFGPECEQPYYYDRVQKIADAEKGKAYWADTPKEDVISYQNPDNSDFRLYWKYMPKFRILDANDFFDSFAVYLLVFLFIAIVCFTAALVISYTRCQTIVLNNQYIFHDLKRLGASPARLSRELRQQCRLVFAVPAGIGMSVMTLLYLMIMYANDNKFTYSEFAGILMCLLVLLLIALLFFLIYRYTLRRVRRQLGIALCP